MSQATTSNIYPVAEQHLLELGLKLYIGKPRNLRGFCWRVTFAKARIETKTLDSNRGFQGISDEQHLLELRL